MKKALFLLYVLLLLSSCNSDVWDGFFYPNKNNLSEYKHLGKFETLEQCKATIASYAVSMGAKESSYDYECGKNCQGSSSGVAICETTSR